MKWSSHAFGSVYKALSLQVALDSTFSWHSFFQGTCHNLNIPWSVHNFIALPTLLFSLAFLCLHPLPLTWYASLPFTLQAQMPILLLQNIPLSALEILHSHHLDCTEPTVLWVVPGKSGFLAHLFNLWQWGHYLSQLWSAKTADAQASKWINMNKQDGKWHCPLFKSILLFLISLLV